MANVTVYLDWDERYPDPCVSLEKTFHRLAIEMPEEEYNDWVRVEKEYNDWCGKWDAIEEAHYAAKSQK